MFFKTRKPTKLEKNETILEYLYEELIRYTEAEFHSDTHDAWVHRMSYLEEQISLHKTVREQLQK